MSAVKCLVPGLEVGAQLQADELPALAARGIRSVINNRPDGEAAEQPASATLAAAARRLGLEYRHLPVVVGQVTDDQVRAFATLLVELPGPVLAFCRTGTRSTTLWALTQAGAQPPERILKTAAEAGYDLAALAPRLLARIAPSD